MAKRFASSEIREAVIDLLSRQFDTALTIASGGFNGYGLNREDFEELRSALDCIKQDLNETTIELMRPDVLDSLLSQVRERETAERARAASWDQNYVRGFRDKLFAPTNRTGWKGNKKLRAEVDELYRPAP